MSKPTVPESPSNPEPPSDPILEDRAIARARLTVIWDELVATGQASERGYRSFQEFLQGELVAENCQFLLGGRNV